MLRDQCGAVKLRPFELPSTEEPGRVTVGSTDVPVAPTVPPIPQSPDLPASVEDLLQLPKSQLEALLSECDEPRSKALLALIYRLAVVEARLADLDARVHTPTAPAPRPGRTDGVQDWIIDASKSDLLEQVFRKNLLLRRLD